VYTYLTTKFTFQYYTHSQLLFGIDFLLTLANPKINLGAVLSCSGKVWYATVVGIFDRHCKIPTLLILSAQNRLYTVLNYYSFPYKRSLKILDFTFLLCCECFFFGGGGGGDSPGNHPRERIQVLKHTVLKEILQSARKYSFIYYENIQCKELSR